MTGTDCPRCHERAQRVGNAMDGCPEYLCGNGHLTHDAGCRDMAEPRPCARCGQRAEAGALLCSPCALVPTP